MIRARRLTKLYGRIRAVDDLGFDVVPGTATGFLAAWGAGTVLVGGCPLLATDADR